MRGRLVPRMWADKDGVQHTEFNILADAVGLSWSTGVAHFIHARLTEPPALEESTAKPRSRMRLKERRP